LPSFPSFSFHYLPSSPPHISSSFLSFPSFPVEVGPFIQLQGLGERCKQCPQPQPISGLAAEFLSAKYQPKIIRLESVDCSASVFSWTIQVKFYRGFAGLLAQQCPAWHIYRHLSRLARLHLSTSAASLGYPLNVSSRPRA